MLRTILILTLVSLTLQLSIPVRDAGVADNSGQKSQSLLNTGKLLTTIFDFVKFDSESFSFS